jgi:hypothetical protein
MNVNLIKEAAPKKRAGRPKLNKENVSFRLLTATRHRLDKALAVTRLNLSAYIQLAIEEQLKRDKIP